VFKEFLEDLNFLIEEGFDALKYETSYDAIEFALRALRKASLLIELLEKRIRKLEELR